MRLDILRTLPVAGLVASAAAVNIHISSYGGLLSSYSLEKSSSITPDKKATGYTLKDLGSINGPGPQPSWLELGTDKKIVYALDENWNGPNGSIASYSITKNGSLQLLQKYQTPNGPVATTLYNKGKGIAVALYGGAAVGSYSVKPDGALESLGNFFFTQAGPGPVAARQEKPHPHEVILDPNDKFIVAPDLGSDLLRIFSIDAKTSKLTEQEPFPVKPGSGPRHGAFYAGPGCKKGSTYFFLVNELTNTVESYNVTYGKSLDFKLIESKGIYGNISTPAGASGAEAIISPDHKFLHTSARNATILNVALTNGTVVKSDTLQTWSIDAATGKLNFVANSPSGGATPRQFSLNKEGTLAGVGSQGSGRFVIMERDVKTGVFGKIVATKEGVGEVNMVIFQE
ncbi:hypothetical protein HYFRA_00004551 [Hymenoscyphus fraxineus]|uniref:Isomerase YbhE n=1 Tax=Hymenoscyphus fraxineus TaxID=746836 RepID=A0A9N9KX20_9HELO|nr:hypothetical protein HYFRA_00004551 [Hymenoscyphus fraxineus]